MQDRLTTEAVEDWPERLQFAPDAPDTPIRFEAEFWYRNDEARRESAETDSPAFSAYYQFCWWIDKFASHGPEEDSELDLASETKTGGEEEVDELELKKRLEALLTAVLDRLKLVVITLDEYETLEGRAKADPALYRLGRKLAEWQVTTVFPVAIQIGGSKLPKEEKTRLCRLIYSFLARRAMCGLTTKNLNQVFQSIAGLFLREGLSLEAFQAYFREQEGDSIRFPRNDEFRQGILEKDAYSIAPGTRLVDILWELEMASRSSMAEKKEKPAKDLSVEHVLPQKWTDEWPFPNGQTHAFDADEPDARDRRDLVNSLGNLTLLTRSLNSSSGNSGFTRPC